MFSARPSGKRQHPRHPARAAVVVCAARIVPCPPRMVGSTRAVGISSSRMVMMFLDSTTMSAYLPGVSDPKTLSEVLGLLSDI